MTWRLVRWGLAIAAAGGACMAGACGYPDFSYGPPGTGGGHAASTSSTATGGGAGGSGGSPVTSSSVSSTSASSTASSSSSGGSGPVTQVSCASNSIDGTMVCNTGQICCVSEDDPDCDHCASGKSPCEGLDQSCRNSHWDVYACDGDEDCDVGDHCCAQLVDNGVNLTVTLVSCFPHACDDDSMTRQMCHSSADCDGFVDYPSCRTFGYSPYKVCQVP